mmetsp:Transcript_9878/g.24811  ORF Transcript_9878/g.24811 Transcript_9878/m.24811 type:complete len:84 (-) Transcript_9878:110-361(-)
MSNEGCVQHRSVQSRAQGAGDPFRSFQVADDIEDADLHDEDIGQQKRPRSDAGGSIVGLARYAPAVVHGCSPLTPAAGGLGTL